MSRTDILSVLAALVLAAVGACDHFAGLGLFDGIGGICIFTGLYALISYAFLRFHDVYSAAGGTVDVLLGMFVALTFTAVGLFDHFVGLDFSETAGALCTFGGLSGLAFFAFYSFLKAASVAGESSVQG